MSCRRWRRAALQDLSQRIHRADSLDRLLDSILQALEEFFGFTHAMILLPGEDDNVLVTVASRGYEDSGIGAEMRVGEGIIGVVGRSRGGRSGASTGFSPAGGG